ncbi:MAG: T9SS type A sorting domain-containing protein [Bacteroidales bacterium]|nr:T9SS type A sorting domain-containing protein [Bacteroidales bacterium]
MKRFAASLFMVLLVVGLASITGFVYNDNEPLTKWNQLRPNDWMMMQRMFPYKTINPEAYDRARRLSIHIRKEAQSFKSGQEDWELVGPFNVGGRITDVEMHPEDLSTIYVCAASGGVYKSHDQGKSWEQIFENEYTQSIGDMGIAKTDKNILYLGTGEPNTGQGSITYDGYGVFKSVDGGTNWVHVGLENAGGIGRVEVDPTNADRVFVAAMGNLFAKNPERGVYRTTDGGLSWENVLFISDSTGAIDLCIHPTHPDTIYAAMWERVRFVDRRTYGGPSSGIYRSTDGGDTWTELTNGLPSTDLGRIGIDISQSDPNILYACYANIDGTWKDIYKTTDGGDSWTALGADLGGTTYYWWFSKIQIHPTNPDIVWSCDFNMHKTTDGGATWQRVNGLHVDQHALYAHPMNPDFVVIGNDGGVYISVNGTSSNQFITKLPVTQFYTCEVNFQHPEQKMGGTQDNGTVRTMTGDTHDWSSIYGGDGFVVRVDPTDDRFMYASSQRGGFGRSTDGGNSFRGGKSGITGTNRWNWKTPYVLDPNTPSTLYIGSQKVWKSTNRAAGWTRISNDLTNGAQAWNYGTITALAVSPLNDHIIYAGTDDGNVWITTNGGVALNWTKVSDPLPVRWVTCVAADPFDEQTGYVAFSGIRYHDFEPHLFRTTDLGATWEDISGNLPDLPINNIIIDPDNQGTFYVATDDGVYVTYDAGVTWDVLGNGMPAVPVLDLNLHRPTRTLLAATFGRSQWRIHLKAASGTGIITRSETKLNIYPNPAADQIHIEFNLTIEQTGQLLVYNMTGQVVKVLHDGFFARGMNRFSWDGSTNGTNRMSGEYICRLVTGQQILAKRIQIIR